MTELNILKCDWDELITYHGKEIVFVRKDRDGDVLVVLVDENNNLSTSWVRENGKSLYNEREIVTLKKKPQKKKATFYKAFYRRNSYGSACLFETNWYNTEKEMQQYLNSYASSVITTESREFEVDD